MPSTTPLIAAPARQPFSRLVTVAATASTNDDLRAELTGPDGRLRLDSVNVWPHLSVLRAVTQTAGRGRAGHTWTTPPYGALTMSVVLRPLVEPRHLAWLPLLAGLAVSRAVRPWLDATDWEARTKWPNDVVVVPTAHDPGDVPGWGTSRKVAGVLTELVVHPQAAGDPQAAPADRGEAHAIILGIGVNVSQGHDELPVPWAASMATVGASVPGGTRVQARTGSGEKDTAERDVYVDAFMRDVGDELLALLDRWEKMGGDPDAGDGSLGAELRASCISLGARLRVQTPDSQVTGTAVGIEPALVLRTRATDGSHHEVRISAGDVTLARSIDDIEPGLSRTERARPDRPQTRREP